MCHHLDDDLGAAAGSELPGGDTSSPRPAPQRLRSVLLPPRLERVSAAIAMWCPSRSWLSIGRRPRIFAPQKWKLLTKPADVDGFEELINKVRASASLMSSHASV